MEKPVNNLSENEILSLKTQIYVIKTHNFQLKKRVEIVNACASFIIDNSKTQQLAKQREKCDINVG